MARFIKYLLALIVLAILLIGGYLYFLGAFDSVLVDERMMGPYTLVYQEHTGSFSEVGPVFDEVYQKLSDNGIDTMLGMGIYYGNPAVVAESELRSEVGSLIDEVQAMTIDREEYNIKEIEQAKYIVVSFPFKNSLSYMIGVMKAYPAIEKYLNANGYSESEYSIELYLADKTYYMMPVK